jgi:hypothetical protein
LGLAVSERENNACDDEDCDDEEGDLDQALRVVAGDGSGVTVDDDLEVFASRFSAAIHLSKNYSTLQRILMAYIVTCSLQ